MDTIDVIDLKTLRKKYLKKTISIDKLKKDVFVDFNKHAKELFLEFTHLVSWSGEEYTYTISIFTDDDFVIQKITALKCERLGGDDARGSTYRGKRTDEYDYYRLDCVLSNAVEDNIERRE